MQQLRTNSIYGLDEVKDLTIETDGASRGNPGPSAIGAVIRDSGGVVVRQISRSIGRATNNQAEYRAVIAALEEASELGAEHVHVRMDSELVVRQLKGQYRVKNTSLRLLFQRAMQILGGFDSYSIVSIPRSQNTEADRLAGAALRKAGL